MRTGWVQVGRLRLGWIGFGLGWCWVGVWVGLGWGPLMWAGCGVVLRCAVGLGLCRHLRHSLRDTERRASGSVTRYAPHTAPTPCTPTPYPPTSRPPVPLVYSIALGACNSVCITTTTVNMTTQAISTKMTALPCQNKTTRNLGCLLAMVRLFNTDACVR